MRRLALVLTALALALLCASIAVASPPPRDTITVRASGRAPIRVLLRVEGKTRVIGWAHGPGTKRKQRVTVRLDLPKHLPSGRWPVIVCVSHGCRRVSWLGNAGRAHLGSPPAETPPTAQASIPPTPIPGPISTVPTEPISYVAGEPFHHTAGAVEYWGYIPRSYDPSNQTPGKLFVFLHGCYGESSGDIWVVDPEAGEEETQDWMALVLSGREGGAEGPCWVPSVDESRVMAALADFETHFNVDRREVILGGYSSGGDLAYRTGFRHSSTFAGLLIENSSPFRDTESSAAESLGAATTKFHIVHLAHSGDTEYPLAGVERETDEVKAAGFPLELLVEPGGHSDATTDPDLREYLLPHIDDGWLAPAP